MKRMSGFDAVNNELNKTIHRAEALRLLLPPQLLGQEELLGERSYILDIAIDDLVEALHRLNDFLMHAMMDAHTAAQAEVQQ